MGRLESKITQVWQALRPRFRVAESIKKTMADLSLTKTIDMLGDNERLKADNASLRKELGELNNIITQMRGPVGVMSLGRDAYDREIKLVSTKGRNPDPDSMSSFNQAKQDYSSTVIAADLEQERRVSASLRGIIDTMDRELKHYENMIILLGLNNKKIKGLVLEGKMELASEMLEAVFTLVAEAQPKPKPIPSWPKPRKPEPPKNPNPVVFD